MKLSQKIQQRADAYEDGSVRFTQHEARALAEGVRGLEERLIKPDDSKPDFKPTIAAEAPHVELGKRSYIVPIDLKNKRIACPVAGCDGEMQLFHDYLSYPSVGVPEEASCCCEKCQFEMPFKYRVRVVLEVDTFEDGKPLDPVGWLKLRELCPYGVGGRDKKSSEYSAEWLRDDHLIPLLQKHKKVIVDLRGLFGFAASALEEFFGGTVRKGYTNLLDRIEIEYNWDDRRWKEDAECFIEEQIERQK